MIQDTVTFNKRGRPALTTILLRYWELVLALIVTFVILLVLFHSGIAKAAPGKVVTPTGLKTSYPADLAQCVTQSGFQMYGSPKCSHCQAQKALFKEAFDFIIFNNCDEVLTSDFRHPGKRCVRPEALMVFLLGFR